MHHHLRLRHADDFARIKAQGRVVHHPFFMISYLQNDLTHNRYGVITNKRLGKAVRRNRIRRQIREALRLLHPTLRSGYDVVVIPKPSIIGQSFWAIHETLQQKLRSVGLVIELEKS